MSPFFLTLIIISTFIGSLFSGLPAMLCLIGVSLLLFLIFVGPASLYICLGSAVGAITTEVYMAIPLFVLMAAIMQTSGMAQQLFTVMLQWMGPLRGGLAIGTVTCTTIIDALSGIGATGTTMMALVALPEMYKRNYNRNMVLGCISAGGALGPLIPPSVLMIIVGGYADLSVAKLFAGGFIPGLLTSFCYCLYIGIRCYIHKEDGIALSKEERLSLKGKLKMSKYVVMPISLMIVLLITIYSGIATPTEAGAIGALGSLAIAGVNRTISWEKIRNATMVALRITCMVMWVILGGGCYSALLTATGSGDLLAKMMIGLSLSKYGLIFVLLIIPFMMGMFIDSVAIAIICLPIFVPIIANSGLDMLWMILLFIMVLVLGYITPPFGLNLFYMKGSAPLDTKMIDIYRGIIPFVILMSFTTSLCVIFPCLIMWLPSLMR
jgi:tripartite ATP-independent transporter DctM subunit